MKNLILIFTILLHVTIAFAVKSEGYKPMVSEGEIITIYSIDDPKRLPSVEEVRKNLKKKKNLVKEGVDDEKADDKKSEVSEGDEESSDSEDSTEDDSSSDDEDGEPEETDTSDEE